MSRQGRAEVSLPAIYFVDSAQSEGLIGDLSRDGLFVGGAQGEGRVRNLSRDGLFLQGALLPKEGDRVVIKFTTPNRRGITVEGTVRWAMHDVKSCPWGFGVELSSYGDDYRVVVEDYLGTQHPSTG